jgi:large subunit ribosomal protein L6
MKINLLERIAIPEGVEVLLEKKLLKVKGKAGECLRKIEEPMLRIAVEGKEVVIKADKATKREKARLYSLRAHLNNMIKGVQNGYKYTLKICSGHFPMNVALSGNTLVVKNFFGEKYPRIVQLKQGAKVKIEGDKIYVESVDKEIAGQVAADIEQTIRLRGRDQRIFQDGIYITEKAE